MEKNLLIIGAGGRGKVVAEIAEDLGYHIAFLDENSLEVIGRIADLENFSSQYEYAFVGIGNNRFREEQFRKLEECNYTVLVLIHPTAYVSRTVAIKKETVVKPKVIVNAGATVKAGAMIEEYRKLEAGEVVLGYEATRVNKK